TTARAESATVSLLFASTAAKTGPREATAEAEMPAPNLRTVRRLRSQSVETTSGVFMVSPEASDNQQEFSRSGWQVEKEKLPKAPVRLNYMPRRVGVWMKAGGKQPTCGLADMPEQYRACQPRISRACSRYSASEPGETSTSL